MGVPRFDSAGDSAEAAALRIEPEWLTNCFTLPVGGCGGHRVFSSKRSEWRLHRQTERDMNMKTRVLIAAVVSAFALPVLAQTPTPAPAGQVRQQNAEIRKDNRDIRSDVRDIRRDTKDIHQDRRERNALQRAEDRAVQRGDVKDAKKLEVARAHEQHQINKDKRDLKHDKADLRKDRKEKRKDVKERHAAAVQVK